MRIALDAMGTDNRPAVSDMWPEASWLPEEFGDTIVLVGDKPTIEAELKNHRTKRRQGGDSACAE